MMVWSGGLFKCGGRGGYFWDPWREIRFDDEPIMHLGKVFTSRAPLTSTSLYTIRDSFNSG